MDAMAPHGLSGVVKRCSVVGLVVAVGGIGLGLCLAALACLISGLSMRPDAVTMRHFVFHDCLVALVVPALTVVVLGSLTRIRSTNRRGPGAKHSAATRPAETAAKDGQPWPR